MTETKDKKDTKKTSDKDALKDAVGDTKSEAKKETKVPEKLFITNETALNAILAAVTKLPWVDANPIIALVQQSFKEVKTDA